MKTSLLISAALLCTALGGCDNAKEAKVPKGGTPAAESAAVDAGEVEARRPALRDTGADASRTIAWVEDVGIPEIVVDRRLERIRRLYLNQRKSFGPTTEARKRRQLTEQLIDDRLLRRHVEASDVTISDAAVQQEIERRVDEVFGSYEALEKHVSLHDMDFESYRADVRQELALRKLLGLGDVPEEIDDERLHQIYRDVANRPAVEEEARVSTLQFRLPAGADASKRRDAERRLRAALAGVDNAKEFAKLAKKIGQGPTARDGGYVGWIERGAVSPAVAREVFEANAEGLTGVVRTPVALQIYWVHERHRAPTSDFERLADELRRQAVEAEFARRREKLLKKLRATRNIRYADSLPRLRSSSDAGSAAD